jgi:ubiquinol-cytochrome c reductase cytochrome b subunit
LFFWIFIADVVMLGWIGSKPPEGIYPMLALLGAIWYYVHFLIILPVLGLIETPRRMPNSITEAVLEKNGGSAHPAGAAAAPHTKG